MWFYSGYFNFLQLKTVRGELEGKVALLNVELEKVKIEAETAKQDFVRGKKDCDREASLSFVHTTVIIYFHAVLYKFGHFYSTYTSLIKSVLVCVQVQDLVAAMDSYRSEHERTMAVKEKVVENLKLQLQQNRSSKVSKTTAVCLSVFTFY